MTDDTMVERIIREVGLHGEDDLDDAVRCICGARLWTHDGGFLEGKLRMRGSIATTARDDHLARALLPLVREAQAEALERAAITARSMSENEPDGYYGQACYEIANALEARAATYRTGDDHAR